VDAEALVGLPILVLPDTGFSAALIRAQRKVQQVCLTVIHI